MRIETRKGLISRIKREFGRRGVEDRFGDVSKRDRFIQEVELWGLKFDRSLFRESRPSQLRSIPNREQELRLNPYYVGLSYWLRQELIAYESTTGQGEIRITGQSWLERYSYHTFGTLEVSHDTGSQGAVVMLEFISSQGERKVAKEIYARPMHPLEHKSQIPLGGEIYGEEINFSLGVLNPPDSLDSGVGFFNIQKEYFMPLHPYAYLQNLFLQLRFPEAFSTHRGWLGIKFREI